MSGRKLLPVIGLLLIAGIAGWFLTRPAAGGAPALPPAPPWDPLTPIRRELTDPDPARRIEGGRHANDIGDAALEPDLLAALASAEAAWRDARLPAQRRESERRVRITLVAALCRLEGPSGVAHTHRFLTDEDPMVRRAAIVTAGRRGITLGIATLRTLLRDPSPDVRMETATAIAQAGPDQVAEEVHAATTEGPAAPRMLLATAKLGGENAAATIGKALRNPALTVPAGEAAVVCITPIPMVQELAAALDDPNETVRRVAIDALRRIGGVIVVDELLRALTDESVHVRRLASQGLATEARDAEHDAILAALQRETDWPVVRDLARVLQRLARPTDAPAIAAVARKAPDGALADLMAALGRCGGPEALTALTELAARDTTEAARGLAEAGAARFDAVLVPAITPLFDHGHYTVQAAALRAAATAGDAAPGAWRDACARLIASPVKPIRLQATAALAAIDPARAAAALLRHAASADPEVSAGAWQCLPKLQGGPAHDAVRRALELGLRDNVAARFGAEAAAALSLPGAGPRIAAILQRGPDAPPLDKQARHAAAQALGRAGRREDAAALVPLLDDQDLTLRAVAAEALFRLLGATDDQLQQVPLMPLRLPYWARRWWAENAGKAPADWSAPHVPAVPTL